MIVETGPGPGDNGDFEPRRVSLVDSSVRRGDIFYADLSPVVGSEQGGVRPVLIIQNDTGNRHSPTVIAAAIHNAIIFLNRIVFPPI